MAFIGASHEGGNGVSRGNGAYHRICKVTGTFALSYLDQTGQLARRNLQSSGTWDTTRQYDDNRHDRHRSAITPTAGSTNLPETTPTPPARRTASWA
jgi:hypothetical protein